MKKYIFFIAALLTAFTSFGVEDPADTIPHKKIYRINKPVVWSIIGIGAVTDALAIKRIKDKPGITDAEIAALNKNIIDPLDRWALDLDISSYTTYKSFSDFGQGAVILLPGLLAFDEKIRQDWKDILLIYTEGHIITFSFYNYSQLGPTFQNKYRPYVYYEEFPMDKRQSGYNRSSFYSGHTASTAYSTFFMAKVYCDYHPEASKFLWYATASVPALAMAYARVRSLDHFPSDNLAGLMLGGALGIIVPELHKFRCKEFSVSMITSPDAVGLGLCWKPSSH